MFKQPFATIIVIVFFYFGALSITAQVNQPALHDISLTQSQASHFARLALKCVAKEYPNKPEHVLNDGQDVQSPKALHPAFYGCYDWHSSVHGHWMLVRLLRLFPNLPEAGEIRAAIGANLSEENIKVEAAYLKQKNRQSFERTYGWAWLLKLAEELSLAKTRSCGSTARLHV